MKAFLLALCVAACSAEFRVDTIGRLKRDIFRDYDKTALPQFTESKPVDVSAGMRMVHMKLTDQGELDAVAWFTFGWTDKRLVWETKKYPGVEVLRLPITDLWHPDLEVYNSVEYGPGYLTDTMNAGKHLALLYPTGKVLWIPATHTKVLCNDQEFANWPWGEYDCSVKLGSWTYSGNHINLTKYNNRNDIGTEDLDANSPVQITVNSFKKDALESKFYDCCPNEPYQSLNFNFKVQRKYRMTAEGRENNPSPAEFLISKDSGY